MDIKSNKENKLLGRRDIEFNVVQDGSTPSKNEIKAELCKKLNLNPDSVIVVKVDQSTGVRQGHGFAHAYPSKEMIEKSEPVYLVNRMNGIKGAKVTKGKKEKAAAKKEPEKK